MGQRDSVRISSGALKGHGFSRAITARQNNRALAPEGRPAPPVLRKQHDGRSHGLQDVEQATRNLRALAPANERIEMEDQLTAPEDRRCIELTLSGYPCRNTPVAERDRCYIHGLFRALNDGRSTIDIPLLEDPQAILYVYSQVARALAQGAMPANANGIIRCYKGAERLLGEQRKREQFEERKKKSGVRSQETGIRKRAASPEAPC